MPDLTPEERQRIYEEEKIRLEAREQIKKEMAAKEAGAAHVEQQRAQTEKQSRAKKGCLIFIAVMAGLGLFFAVMEQRPKSEEVSDVHTYTFDPEVLAGRPFGNGMGSRAFLKNSKNATL